MRNMLFVFKAENYLKNGNQVELQRWKKIIITGWSWSRIKFSSISVPCSTRRSCLSGFLKLPISTIGDQLFHPHAAEQHHKFERRTIFDENSIWSSLFKKKPLFFIRYLFRFYFYHLFLFIVLFISFYIYFFVLIFVHFSYLFYFYFIIILYILLGKWKVKAVVFQDLWGVLWVRVGFKIMDNGWSYSDAFRMRHAFHFYEISWSNLTYIWPT